MPTLTGILCDLSASMYANAGGQIKKEGGNWARSIINVIDDLIKNDVSPNNRAFTIGIGANCRDGSFDVLATIEQFQDSENTTQDLTHHAVVEQILDILEIGGARFIRKWAKADIVVRSTSFEFASVCLKMLKSNRTFLCTFVNECLPSSCRNWDGLVFNEYTQNLYSSGVSTIIPAKERDIKDVVVKAKNILLKKVGSVFTIQNASKIVHGCVGETKLTDDRLKDLMKIVELFIYGGTPLCTSLREASEIFNKSEYKKYTKILFILSDGEAKDDDNINEISTSFLDADVTIVSCFINQTTNIESRKLYSNLDLRWSVGASFLFNLSSQIPTERLPRTVFVKRGWEIDISNNQTKLFLQVNDPENIHDACDLARNVVCCQDALSDILVSVSLDIYINQNNSELKAQMQDEDSCYANASATVVHLSMKRILGRDGGYPSFHELRKDIIKKHGKQKTNTLRVLQKICPTYRIQCYRVGIDKALTAISEKRPLVATFGLTDLEWNQFHEFYNKNPTGILNKTVVDILKRAPRAKLLGHAVVLTSYNSECLFLMNSWGDEWADMGFFRVQNAEVLDMKFIDVFWRSNDLTSNEKAYFKQHGGEVADNLIKQLVGLQKAEYECPLCNCTSLVMDYKGTLNEAICPNCTETFKCNESGNILAMNIYLTARASKIWKKI